MLLVDLGGFAPPSRTLFSLLHTAIKNTLREILTPVPTEWELSLIARSTVSQFISVLSIYYITGFKTCQALIDPFNWILFKP